MRSFAGPLFSLAVAYLVAFGAGAPAYAQEADDTEGEPGSSKGSADALVRSAVTDMEAKHFDTACPAFKKAYRLEPKPVTLFQLAQCEDQRGQITTAAIHYDDYLDVFEHLSPTEQRDERDRERQASSRRQALEPQIPRVTFRLKASAPPGTRVSRIPQGGGDPVDIPVDVQLPIDPGRHFVITEAPGRPRLDTNFEIKKGEKKLVELDVAAPTAGTKQLRYGEPIRPVPTLLPPLDPPMPARRVTAYVLGGVGVASVVAGVVTGAIVWGQKGTLADNCGKNICNPKGEEAADLARISGIVSTVTFSVGGAALAASAILFLTEPPPPKFGGDGFRTAAPLNSPPLSGASFGVKGVW
jgi:hypothetical protein